jgi:DNA-binding NtrC family response regulator
MNEKNNLALVPRPPGVLEKAEPGAKRILSGMVSDTLALARQGPSRKPRGKLLIVDDEDGVRQCMRVLFEEEYDLFMAGDAPTAIELAKQNDIDVAVTNINMPGMSGIELLERLKSLKPEIEVIIATAFETADTRRQALRLGACDYINKPFEISTMRATIRKAMQHRTLKSAMTAARKQSSGNMKGISDLTFQTRPPRIVVLDDEPFTCDALRMLLRLALPYAEILTFTDVEAALEELEREDPDLFTTDYEHPGMRGDELLQLLAARKAKYPVFLISAYGESLALNDFLERFLYQGLNVSLVSKPFTLEQLRPLLSKHLEPRNGPKFRKGAP